jgi:hypothetical protein
MTYINITGAEYDLLNSLKITYQSNNGIVNLICEIESDLSLKLWHKLSEHLIKLSEFPDLQKSNNLIQIYHTIICNVEKAFNPMKLMYLISNVLKNYSGNCHEALEFLESIDGKINKKGEEAIFLKTLIVILLK